MSTTVTVRIDEDLRRALQARARAHGKTLSAMVRETLERAAAEAPFGSRVGHLQGRLRLAPPIGGTWREKVRDPDPGPPGVLRLQGATEGAFRLVLDRRD